MLAIALLDGRDEVLKSIRVANLRLKLEDFRCFFEQLLLLD